MRGILDIKYKLLSFDELVINLDRLSRFKLPEESFGRVFSSVILKCLISPKYSKQELLKEDDSVISDIAAKIWNESVKAVCGASPKDSCCVNLLKYLIDNTFKNIDERTRIFIDTELDIYPLLKKINYEKAPLNLKFLIKAAETTDEADYFKLREKYSLCFPVSKLLIAEGITEEILLPVFADKLNKNFNKNGVYILGAGGKSKSPALYMKLRDRLKIPAVLLFDKDAEEICSGLEKNLLQKDKYILIEHGEFEDILPLELIKRTLNNEYQLLSPASSEDLTQTGKMCINLEDFYRTRALGSFKKAKFAKIIAENVKYDTDITEDIQKIISFVI